MAGWLTHDIHFALYIIRDQEHATQISKWGNSLAIRLPKAVVEKLGLKEGDELKAFTDDSGIMLTRDLTREEALKRLRALRWDLPPGFKFDREEAHERGWRLDDPE